MWKDIAGYEGYYSVSDMGEVKSLDRIVFNKGSSRQNKIRGKLLKQYKNNKGYLYVDLCKNGKTSRFLVHRLVAETYVKKIENCELVNHKDNNPLNNKVENLEWCNSSYNIQYCIKQNRQNLNSEACQQWRHSKKDYLWKPVVQYNLRKEIMQKFNSITEAAEWLIKNDITKNKNAKSNISACCKGKANTAYGYIWEYLE